MCVWFWKGSEKVIRQKIKLVCDDKGVKCMKGRKREDKEVLGWERVRIRKSVSGKGYEKVYKGKIMKENTNVERFR